MALPHNLTQQQIDQVNALVNQGNYAAAWSQLAAYGDSYADNAADVVGTPTSITGEFMHELVQQHWENTAGVGAYEQYFNDVAERHLNNYLQLLGDGNWPDTNEIETSYRDAVEFYQLPPTTAFDSVFTRVVGDGTISHRNIEIDADEDALSPDVDVIKGAEGGHRLMCPR